MSNKTRIAYMYDPDIGCYDYEPGHCMKPFRIRMTHDLVMSYGLYRNMEVYVRHVLRLPGASNRITS